MSGLERPDAVGASSSARSSAIPRKVPERGAYAPVRARREPQSGDVAGGRSVDPRTRSEDALNSAINDVNVGVEA